MSSIDPEAVYEAVRQIPAGTVITYGDLAERVGQPRSSARAIGNVLRGRPDREAWLTTPAEEHDIPWWRVARSDGTLRSDEDDETGVRRQGVEWAKAPAGPRGRRLHQRRPRRQSRGSAPSRWGRWPWQPGGAGRRAGALLASRHGAVLLSRLRSHALSKEARRVDSLLPRFRDTQLAFTPVITGVEEQIDRVSESELAT